MSKVIHKKSLFFLILIIFAICAGLCSCSTNKENQEKINQVIEMIDALPNSNNITIEDEFAIAKARVSYNNLDVHLQKQVTNLNKLETLEKEIVQLRKQAVYQEQAQKVIELIEQLPSEEALVLSDDEVLTSVRNSYDSIEPYARILVTNFQKLESLEIKMSKMKKEASYLAQAQVVVDLIDNLPSITEITIEDEPRVAEARDAYVRLPRDLISFVINIEKLNELEQKIAQLKYEKICREEVQKIIEMIDKLPEESDVTLNDEKKVKSVRNSYKLLDSDFEHLVTNIDKLIALENRIFYLKNEEKNKAAIEKVILAIDQLPSVDEITYDDALDVETARSYYDKLNSHLQGYVTNYDKLIALEAKINEIKDTSAIEKVVQAIEKLPSVEEITPDNALDIETARSYYNELDERLKEYVTNYDKLTSLEAKINEIKDTSAIEKVVQAIEKLPSVEEITYDSISDVETARLYYDELETRLQEYVTNYDKLIALEAKMMELVPYNVQFFNVLEGEIENGTMIEIPKFYLNKTINYYSTGFFQQYQSEVFIYQTSSIGVNEVYQYAFKIGFNYDVSTEKYKVVQIIESSVKLTPDVRLADYYLFIHPANETDYANARMIEIGDNIELDGGLPISPTDGLNVQLVVSSKKLERWTQYCSVTYSGEKNLPVPTRKGYSFNGWYLNPECTGEKVAKVNENAVLYASWVPEKKETFSTNRVDYNFDISFSHTMDIVKRKNSYVKDRQNGLNFRLDDCALTLQINSKRVMQEQYQQTIYIFF